MSFQRHCEIYKAVDGRFYVDLANEEYGGVEDCTTYGPFATEQEANGELEHHSNPGGLYVDLDGTRPVPTVSPNGDDVRPPSGSATRWERRW
jgi:hypothetical protein